MLKKIIRLIKAMYKIADIIVFSYKQNNKKYKYGYYDNNKDS